jgi:hypothetical protein
MKTLSHDRARHSIGMRPTARREDVWGGVGLVVRDSDSRLRRSVAELEAVRAGDRCVGWWISAEVRAGCFRTGRGGGWRTVSTGGGHRRGVTLKKPSGRKKGSHLLPNTLHLPN